MLFLLRLGSGCRSGRGLLHESIQAGLLTSSGILLDDLLLGRLVDGLLDLLRELILDLQRSGHAATVNPRVSLKVKRRRTIAVDFCEHDPRQERRAP